MRNALDTTVPRYIAVPGPSSGGTLLAVSPSRLSAQLAVLIVLMSFQINLQLGEYPAARLLSYALLLTCFAFAHRGSFSRLQLAVLALPTLLAALSGRPLEGFGLGVAAVLGYTVATRYPLSIETVFRTFLVVNLAIVILQFTAATEIVYGFVNYANANRPVSVFDPRFGIPYYLPQVRPAGVFPAPTYVTAYSVLLFVYLFFAQHSGRLFFFLVGVFFALLGSTLALALVLVCGVAMFWRPRFRWLVAGYSIALVIYAFWIPIQFAYLFGMQSAELSIASRTDLANTGGESVLQRNPLVFATIALLVVSSAVALMLWKRIAVRWSMVQFGVAVLLPPLVHDVSSSMFYWFLVSLSFGYMLADLDRERAAKVAAWSQESRELEQTAG